jgi:hypothetical protein
MPAYQLFAEPSEGVLIDWEGTYAWSTPREATYFEPAEGGLELDEDPRPIAVTYQPHEGEEFSIDDIQFGSILHHLLVAKYGLPSDGDQWEAAGDAHEAHSEDTRW